MTQTTLGDKQRCWIWHFVAKGPAHYDGFKTDTFAISSGDIRVAGDVFMARAKEEDHEYTNVIQAECLGTADLWGPGPHDFDMFQAEGEGDGG